MTQEGARTNIAQFANRPVYKEPAVQSIERQTVRKLTDITSLDALLDNLDASIISSLPAGAKVTCFMRHGLAYWTRTAVVRTVEVDGTSKNYFLKITHTDIGKGNLRGEYESMKTIHDAVPDLVPKPIALGTYSSDPDAHFFLMQFVDMTDDIPGPESLPAKIAQMHKKCLSPTNEFGFVVPTNMGALIQPNTWQKSWEFFFSGLLQRCFAFEQGMHGKDEAMQKMFDIIISRVVPRLLRPLETNGNRIEACFVHGDLWDGNTCTEAERKPMIFDASGFYAHNEFELGPWFIERHQIHKQYILEYRKHFQVSQPEEDFEDRLQLYALRFNLTSSGCYLNNLRFRELVIKDMHYLIAKFCQGDLPRDISSGRHEDSHANPLHDDLPIEV